MYQPFNEQIIMFTELAEDKLFIFCRYILKNNNTSFQEII